MSSKKIANDKYYTSKELANNCWNKILKIIGEENISEIIEPACGNGSFFHHKDIQPHFAFDIETKVKCQGIIIKECDYLKEDINYLEGRLIITNPPYGRCLNLAQKFFKKAIQECDYIAFILPIGQLNNSQSMFEFDLIHSENLGIQKYSDRELHCCFNIYQRPINGEFNKRKSNKIKDITIYRQDSKNYEHRDFDIRLCYWGNGTAGKILKDNETYSAEYKIKINNLELKAEIIDILENFNWKEYLNCIAMRKIQQFHIIDILKEQITELE